MYYYTVTFKTYNIWTHFLFVMSVQNNYDSSINSVCRLHFDMVEWNLDCKIHTSGHKIGGNTAMSPSSCVHFATFVFTVACKCNENIRNRQNILSINAANDRQNTHGSHWKCKILKYNGTKTGSVDLEAANPMIGQTVLFMFTLLLNLMNRNLDRSFFLAIVVS